MKKLSSKQKLIGAIAIILVSIILAIVVTTNVIDNNVGSEGYLATTANLNSNLVASYIKEGITIGGITGTLESLNTFDATATAEDIIWGETAYVKGKKVTGTKVVTVAQAQESQKVFEENTILLDDYGNSVKIPEGFKIAEDSATSITGGIVIEDVSAEGATEYTKGSQFVWVPVGDIKTNDNGDISSIELGRYSFSSDGKETLIQEGLNWSDTSNSVVVIEGTTGESMKELSSSTYGNATSKDLGEFVTKALNSRGYYIGRYEAGDAYATNSSRTGSQGVSNSNNPITCKKGVYPYNYINQLDASKLCQGMYNNDDFKSDLVNSYAWDTAIVFIQTFSSDKNYSVQSGINTAKEIQKCGESILENVDTGDDANDRRCNIYDMAGNMYELSTECCLSGGYEGNDHCVRRGGCFETHKGYYGMLVNDRSSCNQTSANDFYSCRPILYL